MPNILSLLLEFVLDKGYTLLEVSVKAVQKLMEKLHLTAEQAMDVLEIPNEDRGQYHMLLNGKSKILE